MYKIQLKELNILATHMSLKHTMFVWSLDGLHISMHMSLHTMFVWSLDGLHISMHMSLKHTMFVWSLDGLHISMGKQGFVISTKHFLNRHFLPKI